MEVDSMSEQIDTTPQMGSNIIPLPSCSTALATLHDWQLPQIDDSNTNLEKAPYERFVYYLDQIDTKVERLRKEALDLQDKKDTLLVSIDLIKNHEQMQKLNEDQQGEVTYYIQRVGARLGTVDLSVKTVRNKDQEESLHQVNVLIDTLITSGEPVLSRQRCQTFLNACSASDMSIQKTSDYASSQMNIDKTFENFLLGCTLDDQKNIKKRLYALINYLNKQIVTD